MNQDELDMNPFCDVFADPDLTRFVLRSYVRVRAGLYREFGGTTNWQHPIRMTGSEFKARCCDLITQDLAEFPNRDPQSPVVRWPGESDDPGDMECTRIILNEKASCLDVEIWYRDNGDRCTDFEAISVPVPRAPGMLYGAIARAIR
jgi:hypothetical protein